MPSRSTGWAPQGGARLVRRPALLPSPPRRLTRPSPDKSPNHQIAERAPKSPVHRPAPQANARKPPEGPLACGPFVDSPAPRSAPRGKRPRPDAASDAAAALTALQEISPVDRTNLDIPQTALLEHLQCQCSPGGTDLPDLAKECFPIGDLFAGDCQHHRARADTRPIGGTARLHPSDHQIAVDRFDMDAEPGLGIGRPPPLLCRSARMGFSRLTGT